MSLDFNVHFRESEALLAVLDQRGKREMEDL